MPVPEAFSRVLIDRALAASGWDLLNPRAVRFELNGSNGRADYVLLGRHGPLCVLEAKNPNIDPYEAKDQARGYAENLGAPFVILSNGSEHWFWNLPRAHERDAYRIERLPSPADLDNLRLKNLQPPRALLTENIGPEYLKPYKPDFTLRGYQIAALDAVAKQFDRQQRRQFLLEMATGTGKTMLCAALIRRFLTTRNAERVLFLVDRIELAKQTIEDFEIALREFKPVIYKTARRRPAELLGSSVVIATLQSLQVNRRFRTEFTPFHFDLVVNDEAHRSIYGDAREVVQFFQATRVGLTATPKAYLRNINLSALGRDDPKALEARQLRDTYNYFGCQPGEPTFRYDLVDAVNDPDGPFLCLPKIFDIRSDITTQALAEGGWAVNINEQDENYKVKDLERKVFVPARNRLMCEALLKHAQKSPDGQIGKTIIFAVSQNHATALEKILNELQPGVAVTITSRIAGASDIAKDFRDGNRDERIACTVDMLSTGYNCKDLLNVALMRPVFSPTDYIQIKGRGTRLFTFRIGNTEYEKKHFFLLDFCGVCEYFEEEYDYTMPLKVPKPRGEEVARAATDVPPGSIEADDDTDAAASSLQTGETPSREIPVWQGVDIVVSEEIRIVGPQGEKVDVMTFRGSFERDINDFASENEDFAEAARAEDDDAVETIMQERFLHRPEMFYSADKLIKAYGVPAPVPAFAYNALGVKPLPTRQQIIDDTIDSIAALFNLRYNEQQWLSATANMIADDPIALRRFIDGDIGLFSASQFRQLGGLETLARFSQRDDVFEALRQSRLVRQTLIGSEQSA